MSIMLCSPFGDQVVSVALVFMNNLVGLLLFIYLSASVFLLVFFPFGTGPQQHKYSSILIRAAKLLNRYYKGHSSGAVLSYIKAYIK